MSVKHEKAFKQLLVLDSLRGEDSTGVAFVQKWTGQVTVAKQLGDPFALFQDNRFVTNIAKMSRALIGHNRYATSGGVSRQTAHPFDMETIVGVHNGTLSSKNQLLDHQDFKVDSENLFHHIEQRSLEDALSKLGGYGNAWALVWWDKVNETLNMLRNKERPLYVCQADNDKVLFWASEAWMIEATLARNDIKHGEIVMLGEDKLFTANIDKNGVISKPTLRRVAAPPPPPFPVVTGTVYKHQKKTVVEQVAANNTTKAVVHVIGEAKKPSEVQRLDVSKSYAKGAVLEILVACKEAISGAEYLSLFDQDRSFDDIRLYLRPDNQYLKNNMGAMIKGDITGFSMPDGMGSKGYFKVSPHTVELITVKKDEKRELTNQEIDELNNLITDTERDESLYLDEAGKKVTRHEWLKKYKDCIWCGNPLAPEDHNIFTGEGECVCPACTRNEEVLDYFKNFGLCH